jgi:DNA-binding LacI/PurR family transcriptional regulator
VNDNGIEGSRIAVEHLIGLGHRRIAHLDGGTATTAAARRKGYRMTMRDHGLSPVVVPSEHTDTAGEKAVRALLARSGRTNRPTALFAGNDFNAFGAITALEEEGLRVPGDISVVGYDNTSLSGLRRVSLTTVDQPRHRMGRLAVEALLERVRGQRTEPARHLLQPALVVRETTGAPPGASPSSAAAR